MDKGIHSPSQELEVGTCVCGPEKRAGSVLWGGVTGSAAPALSPAAPSLSEAWSPGLVASGAGSSSSASGVGRVVSLAQPLVGPVCKACWESMLVLQDANLKRLGLSPKHPQLPLIITVPSHP